MGLSHFMVSHRPDRRYNFFALFYANIAKCRQSSSPPSGVGVSSGLGVLVGLSSLPT